MRNEELGVRNLARPPAVGYFPLSFVIPTEAEGRVEWIPRLAALVRDDMFLGNGRNIYRPTSRFRISN